MVSMLGLNIFGNQSPLATIPFFIKLPICIFLDLIGLGLYFPLSPLTPLITPILLAFPIPAILYAVVCAMLMMAFYNSVMLGILVFVAKEPIALMVNAIPMLTMACLWNGYKTGWRY